MEVNPYATYDTLSIALRTTGWVGSIRYADVHLLAYLGCLLSIYQGREPDEWGYSFTSTPDGAPFSSEIEVAVATLGSRGYLSQCDVYIRSAESARFEFEVQKSFESNQDRDAFIEAACSCTLAFPLSLIRSGILHEPEMYRTRRVLGTRPLLEAPGVKTLRHHFELLRSALGKERVDLFVPAQVWLTYLLGNVQGAMSLDH